MQFRAVILSSLPSFSKLLYSIHTLTSLLCILKVFFEILSRIGATARARFITLMFLVFEYKGDVDQLLPLITSRQPPIHGTCTIYFPVTVVLTWSALHQPLALHLACQLAETTLVLLGMLMLRSIFYFLRLKSWSVSCSLTRLWLDHVMIIIMFINLFVIRSHMHMFDVTNILLLIFFSWIKVYLNLPNSLTRAINYINFFIKKIDNYARK